MRDYHDPLRAQPCLTLPRNRFLVGGMLRPFSPFHGMDIDCQVPAFGDREPVVDKPTFDFELIHDFSRNITDAPEIEYVSEEPAAPFFVQVRHRWGAHPRFDRIETPSKTPVEVVIGKTEKTGNGTDGLEWSLTRPKAGASID